MKVDEKHGENIGETNFAGVVFSWLPGEKKEKEKEKSTEGNSDEFSNFDEFEEFSEPKKNRFLRKRDWFFTMNLAQVLIPCQYFMGQWLNGAPLQI